MSESVSQQVIYESLDACAEAVAAQGMDVELIQLGPGSGRVALRTTPGRLLNLQRVQIDVPAIRHGALKPGVVSFAIWDERRPTEGRWCGRPFGERGVSLFPDEFSASGAHRLDGTVVEISQARCRDMAALLEVDLPPILAGPRTFPLAPAALNTLSENLMLLERGEGGLDCELEVLAGIVGAIGRSGSRIPRANSRARAFTTSREFIRSRGADVPSVPEICAAAGVSLRTLEYAFRETVGMTPLQYLKVYRLRQVRGLLVAGASPTVADAANAWGFWHMGKFAADYRSIYGVKPSADLCR
jgi:AraC family ethanolamine operon transcriptional activator